MTRLKKIKPKTQLVCMILALRTQRDKGKLSDIQWKSGHNAHDFVRRNNIVTKHLKISDCITLPYFCDRVCQKLGTLNDMTQTTLFQDKVSNQLSNSVVVNYHIL